MARNVSVPAAYLVLHDSGRILLLQRENTGYQDGHYSFIAGHVENGESFSECIIREAFEEAGIVIDENDLEFLHTMYRKKGEFNSEERVDVFFGAKKWSGEIKNMEPQKCSDLSWFDTNSIPENTIPYIRKSIEHIGSGVAFSEYGWKAEEI